MIFAKDIKRSQIGKTDPAVAICKDEPGTTPGLLIQSGRRKANSCTELNIQSCHIATAALLLQPPNPEVSDTTGVATCTADGATPCNSLCIKITPQPNTGHVPAAMLPVI